MSERATRVTTIGDRVLIETTARRSEAILLVLAGATLNEAGLYLGVSHERIRQYLADAGLSAGLRTRWDNGRMPRWFKRRKWRQARRARRKARAVQLVGIIRDFYVGTGRVPSHLDVARVVWPECTPSEAAPRLIGHLDPSQPRRASRLLAALWRMAGIPHELVGQRGTKKRRRCE